MKRIALIAVLVQLLTSCATSPTGRKQLIFLPDSQMNEMGIQAFAEMKKTVPQEKDSKTNTYVKCVAMAIAKTASDRSGVSNWEVVVFKDDTANAFALPGGKIGVHTGILKVAKTPGQLAAVLGHEVGHVIARHGAERMSQNLLAQGGIVAANIALQNSEQKGLILGSLALGSQFGVLLPFSRKHESEADQIGQELMAKAGFDPAESVKLWENMGKATGKGPPEFLSTHPSHDTRIHDLQAGLDHARGIYEAAKKSGKNPRCEI